MTSASLNSLFAHFDTNPLASLEEIERVQEALAFILPTGYVKLLLTANGGEGFIGKSYLILSEVEELVSKNISYNVAEFAPALFLFGSNGGGEAFGFDTRTDASPIVSVPFVTMELSDAKVVAPDFDAFLSTLFTS